jgi:hypothetical protein
MKSDSGPKLLACAPYFPVAHLEKAAAYCEDVLGFPSDYVGGEPPHFAMHRRDGLTIMLRLVPEPEEIVPNEAQGGS